MPELSAAEVMSGKVYDPEAERLNFDIEALKEQSGRRRQIGLASPSVHPAERLVKGWLFGFFKFLAVALALAFIAVKVLPVLDSARDWVQADIAAKEGK